MRSFPEKMQSDVALVIDFLNAKQLEIHSKSEMEIFLNGEKVVMPYRIYTSEPKDGEELRFSNTQQVILNCLYLTHNNGFLRQKRLESLKTNFDDYVIPYKMKVLSEYVIQIINELDTQINENTIQRCLMFVHENPKYWSFIKSRITSYWGEYFKYSCTLNDYVGYKILKEIDVNLKIKLYNK